MEIAEKDGFKNIRDFIPIAGELFKPEAKETFVEARAMKDQSIYTSYAKDIFLAMYANEKIEATNINTNQELMRRAIEVVKQAKEAFK